MDGGNANNIMEGNLWNELGEDPRPRNNHPRNEALNNNPDGAPAANQDEPNDEEGWDGRVRNILDGGSAVENKTILQCELSIHLIYTGPAPDGVPSNHPIYNPGSYVEIGLDRSTKFLDLFQRYCTFANTHTDNNSAHLEPKDLEFYHCFVLEQNQSVDTSALMHKDKIRVRALNGKEKQLRIERLKLQYEMDKNYFEQLRMLMPDLTPSPLKCDVIFYCTGRITDDKGLVQEVLNNHVRGHSAILSRRCPWLKLKIALAKMIFRQQEEDKMEQERLGLFNRKPLTSPNQVDPQHFNEHDNIVIRDHGNIRQEQRNFHDQNIVVDDEFNPDVWQNGHNPLDGSVNHHMAPPSANAHAVEDDEEDVRGSNSIAATSMGFSEAHQMNAAIVTLNHPPEAVKLLLEYCYTNRVISLGYEAYVKSFKPLDPAPTDWLIEKYSSFVSPFHSNKPSAWPHDGLPVISLPVVLAGIQLSEEASLPRLSLMCEIAASLLVSTTSALDVLGFCEIQQRKSGNALTILRRAVMMNHVFIDGPKSVLHPSNGHSLNRTLRDKKETVVPGLLSGMKDIIQDLSCPKTQLIGGPTVDERKAILLNAVKHYCELIDSEDKKARNRERKGWRREKRIRRSLKDDETDAKAIIYDMDDEGFLEYDIVSASLPNIIRLNKK